MSDQDKHHEDLHLSWEDIHKISEDLAVALEGKSKWKGIVAVTKGGMVPSYIVAKELGINLIETFCMYSYNHQDQEEAEILKIPDIGDGEGWLVIDDLVDTGNSFAIVREKLPKAYFACLYAKPMGIGTTDSFITEVSQETWIHFPWEQRSSSLGSN